MKKTLLTILFLLIVSNTFLYAQKNKDKYKDKYKDKEQHQVLNSKFALSAGAFIPIQSIKLKVNGEIADKFDFGKTFNLDDGKPTVYFKFDWRFKRMWRFTAEYFSIKASNTVTLDKKFEWEGITHEIGATLKGGYSFDMYRVMVSRVITKGFKYEWGIGIGFHAIETGAFVETKGSFDDNNFESERQSVSVFLPLPNIGLWGIYAPSPKWSLLGRLDWLGLKWSSGTYKGVLWDIEGKVNYNIIKNFGISAGYRYLSLDIDVQEKNWDGNVDLKFKGPVFGVFGNF
jgi:hypothetical protein